MHPLKFILKQSFFFAILIATACTTQQHNLPILPNPTGQKKNSNPSIAISSTSANAIVCIGSNNSIHMGATGQEAQANTDINDLDHSKPGNQHTITSEGAPIPITPTDPNDRALVESSNTNYRQDRPTQKQLKQTNKIPKDQHKTTAENNKKIEVEESKGSRNGTEQSREKELEELKKFPDPPNQTITLEGLPDPPNQTTTLEGLPDPPNQTTTLEGLPDPPNQTTTLEGLPDPPNQTTTLEGLPDPPNQTTNNDKASELEGLKENLVNLLNELDKLERSTISGHKQFKRRSIYDDNTKLKRENLKNLLKELKNLDPGLCLEEKFKCITQKIENNYIDINKLKKEMKTPTKNDKRHKYKAL